TDCCRNAVRHKIDGLTNSREDIPRSIKEECQQNRQPKHHRNLYDPEQEHVLQAVQEVCVLNGSNIAPETTEKLFRRTDADSFFYEDTKVDSVNNRSQIERDEYAQKRRQKKQGGLMVTHRFDDRAERVFVVFRRLLYWPLTSYPSSLAFLRHSFCQASR